VSLINIGKIELSEDGYLRFLEDKINEEDKYAAYDKYFEDEFMAVVIEAIKVMVPKHLSYGKGSYADLDTKEALNKIWTKLEMKMSRIKKLINDDAADQERVTFRGYRFGDTAKKIKLEDTITVTDSQGNVKEINLRRLLFEGLEDAYIDMLNYCVFSILINRNKWLVKLSPEAYKTSNPYIRLEQK